MPISPNGAWRELGWAGQLPTHRLSQSEVRQRHFHSHNVLRQIFRFSQGSVMREEIKEGKPDYYLSKNSKCMKKLQLTSWLWPCWLFYLHFLQSYVFLKYLRCRFWRHGLHTAVLIHWQSQERFIFIGLLLGLMECVYFIPASYSTEGVVIQ